MPGAHEHVQKLSSAEWRDCERLVQRFEEARRRGETPALEEYLPAADALRLVVLVELVHTDLEFRLQAGKALRVEEYLQRFPELGAVTATVVDLAAAEFALRRQREPNLTEEEYQQRFPHLREALAVRLPAKLQEATVRTPGSERPDLDQLPAPGERLGDFDLLAELGRGSFGRVFLARQVSLDRPVALKVSANVSHEARTLASLEHPHIVAVFSETVEPGRDLRLLCMRYVPGSTLERVLKFLAGVPFPQRSGSRLLTAIASSGPSPVVDRAPDKESALTDCDFVEAVCWIGSRMAEALSFAHGRGVLHRDIKPANVLLDRQGRPLLADFNLALDSRRDGADRFGGTQAYMAPEHLLAFQGRASPEDVDQRSDIYALGVILLELVTGRRPIGQLSARPIEPAVPPVLDCTIRRCLEPEPANRYQTAAELVRALEGCREWQRTQNALPAAGPLTRATCRHPRLMSVLLPLLPHLAGAAVDLAYNSLGLATYPDGARWQATFTRLALGYTAVTLLATGAAAYLLTMPMWRVWQLLQEGAAVDNQSLAATRRWAVRIPFWALVLSSLGWLPGGVVVPLVLAALAGPLPGTVFVHLGLSFSLAGLIALTYCVYAALFIALRVGYPGLWNDARGMWQEARVELAGLRRWLGSLQLLAGLVPLTAGAALLLSQFGSRPEPASSTGYGLFQLLLLTLILLGMVGSGLAAYLHNYLRRTLEALTGDGVTSA